MQWSSARRLAKTCTFIPDSRQTCVSPADLVAGFLLTVCGGVFVFVFSATVMVAYREFGEGLVRIRCLAS